MLNRNETNMKKNLTESFVSINSYGKFLKRLLFISLVLLSLNSCVNFRSGAHPKLVRNVKTLPTTAQGNLAKNDTLTTLIADEIALEAKRSEVISSPVLANIPDVSKNQFTALKSDLQKNILANLTSKFKIKTNEKKLNAIKTPNKEETNEEMDIRQSNKARLFGILAIVSFFSIFLIPLVLMLTLVLIFCALAFYYGKRVLKRGSAKEGSKEYRRAEFWATFCAGLFLSVIALTLFLGILFLLVSQQL